MNAQDSSLSKLQEASSQVTSSALNNFHQKIVTKQKAQGEILQSNQQQQQDKHSTQNKVEQQQPSLKKSSTKADSLLRGRMLGLKSHNQHHHQGGVSTSSHSLTQFLNQIQNKTLFLDDIADEMKILAHSLKLLPEDQAKNNHDKQGIFSEEENRVASDLIRVHQQYLEIHEKSLYLLNNVGIFHQNENQNTDHTSNPNSSNQQRNNTTLEPSLVNVKNGYQALNFTTAESFQNLLLEVRENPFFLAELLQNLSTTIDAHSFFKQSYDTFLFNMSQFFFHNLYIEAAFGEDHKQHLLRLVVVFLFNKKSNSKQRNITLEKTNLTYQIIGNLFQGQTLSQQSLQYLRFLFCQDHFGKLFDLTEVQRHIMLIRREIKLKQAQQQNLMHDEQQEQEMSKTNEGFQSIDRTGSNNMDFPVFGSAKQDQDQRLNNFEENKYSFQDKGNFIDQNGKGGILGNQPYQFKDNYIGSRNYQSSSLENEYRNSDSRYQNDGNNKANVFGRLQKRALLSQQKDDSKGLHNTFSESSQLNIAAQNKGYITHRDNQNQSIDQINLNQIKNQANQQDSNKSQNKKSKKDKKMLSPVSGAQKDLSPNPKTSRQNKDNNPQRDTQDSTQKKKLNFIQKIFKRIAKATRPAATLTDKQRQQLESQSKNNFAQTMRTNQISTLTDKETQKIDIESGKLGNVIASGNLDYAEYTFTDDLLNDPEKALQMSKKLQGRAITPHEGRRQPFMGDNEHGLESTEQEILQQQKAKFAVGAKQSSILMAIDEISNEDFTFPQKDETYKFGKDLHYINRKVNPFFRDRYFTDEENLYLKNITKEQVTSTLNFAQVREIHNKRNLKRLSHQLDHIQPFNLKKIVQQTKAKFYEKNKQLGFEANFLSVQDNSHIELSECLVQFTHKITQQIIASVDQVPMAIRGMLQLIADASSKCDRSCQQIGYGFKCNQMCNVEQVIRYLAHFLIESWLSKALNNSLYLGNIQLKSSESDAIFFVMAKTLLESLFKCEPIHFIKQQYQPYFDQSILNYYINNQKKYIVLYYRKLLSVDLQFLSTDQKNITQEYSYKSKSSRFTNKELLTFDKKKIQEQRSLNETFLIQQTDLIKLLKMVCEHKKQLKSIKHASLDLDEFEDNLCKHIKTQLQSLATIVQQKPSSLLDSPQSPIADKGEKLVKQQLIDLLEHITKSAQQQENGPNQLIQPYHKLSDDSGSSIHPQQNQKHFCMFNYVQEDLMCKDKLQKSDEQVYQKFAKEQDLMSKYEVLQSLCNNILNIAMLDDFNLEHSEDIYRKQCKVNNNNLVILLYRLFKSESILRLHNKDLATQDSLKVLSETIICQIRELNLHRNTDVQNKLLKLLYNAKSDKYNKVSKQYNLKRVEFSKIKQAILLFEDQIKFEQDYCKSREQSYHIMRYIKNYATVNCLIYNHKEGGFTLKWEDRCPLNFNNIMVTPNIIFGIVDMKGEMKNNKNMILQATAQLIPNMEFNDFNSQESYREEKFYDNEQINFYDLNSQNTQQQANSQQENKDSQQIEHIKQIGQVLEEIQEANLKELIKPNHHHVKNIDKFIEYINKYFNSHLQYLLQQIFQKNSSLVQPISSMDALNFKNIYYQFMHLIKEDLAEKQKIQTYKLDIGQTITFINEYIMRKLYRKILAKSSSTSKLDIIVMKLIKKHIFVLDLKSIELRDKQYWIEPIQAMEQFFLLETPLQKYQAFQRVISIIEHILTHVPQSKVDGSQDLKIQILVYILSKVENNQRIYTNFAFCAHFLPFQKLIQRSPPQNLGENGFDENQFLQQQDDLVLQDGMDQFEMNQEDFINSDNNVMYEEFVIQMTCAIDKILQKRTTSSTVGGSTASSYVQHSSLL